MKAILVCVMAAGMVATVNSICTSMTAGACGTEQIGALASAGIDMADLCTAYKTYIRCLTEAGCFDDTRYSLILKTAQKYVIASCDGHMTTASVATLLLTLFAMLIN